MTLFWQELNITYEPGDTFGIVCPNEDKSVEDLISRFLFSHNFLLFITKMHSIDICQ